IADALDISAIFRAAGCIHAGHLCRAEMISMGGCEAPAERNATARREPRLPEKVPLSFRDPNVDSILSTRKGHRFMPSKVNGVVRVGLIGSGGISGAHGLGFLKHADKIKC